MASPRAPSLLASFRQRRLLPLAVALCAASVEGCHSGDAGVHVVVTLDTPDAAAWGLVAFDHITVTASSASHVAVVCLFPRAEGQRALVVPAPAPSDPDPCADLHDGYAGVNTVYPPGSIFDDWDLVGNPWTLNFDGISSGDTVSVEARAIFGGAAAVAAPVGVIASKGSAQADGSFPLIVLELELPPNDTFWGAGADHCPVGDTLDTYDNPPTFAAMAATACPRVEPNAAYGPALSPVTTPSGEVGRIPAVVASGCDGGEPGGVVVWRSDRIPVPPDGGCVSVELDGRFAACDPANPGDAMSCNTSVRCVPPTTDLAVLSGSTVIEAQNISCVPTYPEAVGYVMSVDSRVVDAGEFSIGLVRRPSEGTCFFDVWNFFWGGGTCP
jgi:hypothetical protein